MSARPKGDMQINKRAQKPITIETIRRTRGILKCAPEQKPLAEEWAEYKKRNTSWMTPSNRVSNDY